MDKQSITSIGQISECGGGDSYKEKIVEMTKEIADTWILNQIYRFIINITKEGG